MKGLCILCLAEKQLTPEHVIPESLGGAFKLRALCKSCNDRVGGTIDGPFINSFPIQLARFVGNMKGKSGFRPNPFGREAAVVDNDRGIRAKLDEQLEPHIVPQVGKEDIQDGRKKISVTIDKDDRDKLPHILRKKILRGFRKENPDVPEHIIQKTVDDLVEQALKNTLPFALSPTLRYEVRIKMNDLLLEYVKIAYEMAYYVFGSAYVRKSASAELLRNALRTRHTCGRVRGRVPIPDEAFPLCFEDRNAHYILVIQRGCYIRLLGLPGVIGISDQDEPFSVSENEARILVFDATAKRYREQLFVEYLASLQGGF